MAGLSNVSWVENTWTILMMLSDTFLLMDGSPVILAGWPTPLKNDGVKVSWDDDSSQLNGKIIQMFQASMYTSSLYKPWCFQGQSMGFCWATGSLSHTMNGKSLHEMMTSPNWAYLAWSANVEISWDENNLIPTSKSLERFLRISLIVFWDIIGLAMDGIL